MREHIDLTLLIAGMAGGIVFALYPFVTRKYVYRHWAKLAACIVCIAALAWGALGLVLYHSTFAVSRDLAITLRYTKVFFAVLCIGTIAVLFIARPWRKRTVFG